MIIPRAENDKHQAKDGYPEDYESLHGTFYTKTRKIVFFFG